MVDHAAIPLVTVGGFLGAGKTTLVNHILAHAQGQRIVVFVNDFGAINIDYDLIETVDTDRVSLANGCVCCSLNDDLIGAIVSFCETDPPDAFVVEASGVADPRALDQSIAALQRAGRVTLAQRVYLLDAENFGTLGYADTEMIVDHVAACDLVVLNKADMATRERLDHFARLLQRAAPFAAQIETSFARLPPDALIHMRSDLRKLAAFEGAHHSAEARFENLSLADIGPVPQAQFMALLEGLHKTTLRAKGVVYFAEDPTVPIRFDHVGQRCSVGAIDVAQGGLRPAACFVAIGWRGRFDGAGLRAKLGVLTDA